MHKNACSKYFMTEDEVLLGERHLSSKNHCAVFKFCDHCSCVGSLWLTITETVDDATAVVFSKMILICQNSTLCQETRS